VDGVIANLSLDTTTGSVNFGMLTAIRSDGIAVSSVEKTTDIHHSKAQVLAYVANLQTQIDSNSLVINALQATVTGLGNALNTLTSNALTMKFENGISNPVHELQFKTADFPGSAYYPTSGTNTRAILKVQTAGPADQNPY
jgi:hypothetical protein